MQSNPLWPVNIRFSQLKSDISVDVTIVGGGIAGISCAYRLKEAGYNVALIEKDEIGSGATGASSGVLYYGTGTNFVPAVKLFGFEKANYLWKETGIAISDIIATAKKYDIPCGLRQCGGIMLAKTQEDLKSLKEEQESLSKCGISTGLLDTEKLKSIFPRKSFLAGLSFDACAQIHPGLFSSMLAKDLDINIYENSPFLESKEENGKIFVKTPNGKIICSKLIFATNRQPCYGLEKYFKLESSAIFASQPIENVSKTWSHEKIMWSMEDDYDIIYPRGDRLILELYRSKDVQSKLDYYYPDSNFKVDKTWGSVWAKPNDMLPIFGEIEKNVFTAIGMGDQGIVASWTCGMHLVNAIEGKSDTLLEMTSPRRFTKSLSSSF